MEDDIDITDIQDILLGIRRYTVEYTIHIEKVCPICETPFEYLMHYGLKTIVYPCQHTEKEIVEDIVKVEENIPLEKEANEPVGILILLRICLLLLLPALAGIYTIYLFFMMFFRGQ